MSVCEQADIIRFRITDSSVRYYGTFYSLDNKYIVTLSITTRRRRTQSRHVLINSLDPAETVNLVLTISCVKQYEKYIEIKVNEIGTERILFQESSPMVSNIITTLLTVEKKPAIYKISVITCEDISTLRRTASLLRCGESNGEKQELEKLSTDIKNLFENNKLSDVILTDGENKMELHKVILSARSSVFERMFQCPMKESKEGIVTITDIPFDVLKVLVYYMYSGVAHIETTDMARELYIAADKYDVQNLKKICLSKLRPLKYDDVLDTLMLANMYDEIDLKEAALKFIAKYYSIINVREKWSNFVAENPYLVIEILNLRIGKLENKVRKPQ